MTEERSYLNLLRFDPKLLKSFAGKYLSNLRLMVLLLLSICIVGAMSLINLPKTLYPEVKIPVVLVTTIFPGAGPNDVESLISVPLEKEIKRIKGVDTYSSTSQENSSVIAIQFDSNYDPKEARDEVQAAVNKITNFPDDAMDPEVRELDFENEPVWDFALEKTQGDEDLASLMRLAQRIKDEVEDVPSVDRVSISGLDEREIQVLIRPDVIVENKINPNALSQAIRNAVQSYPAGSVEVGDSNFALTIDKAVFSIEDLRQIPVSFSGKDFKLYELAELSEVSKSYQSPAFLVEPSSDPKEIVVFSVYKTPGGRIDVTKNDVKEAVDRVMEDAGDSYRIKSITDYSKYINDQISDLGENFQQTLLLVFLSMLLLYGVRQALIASFAIPISLLVVFSVMAAQGFTINFISLFSILIALGLFVDNAVVIIEAYTSYFKSGKFSPLETALLVWKDFFVELFSINLLTVWAFLPMLITKGVIGEFTKPIPIIVSVAMMGSAAMAFLFTLPSMMILSKFKVPKRVKVFLSIFGFLFLLFLVSKIIPNSVLFLPTLLALGLLIMLLFFFRKEIFALAQKRIKKLPATDKLVKFIYRSFDHGFISLERLSNGYRKLVIYLLNSKKARIATLLIILIFTVFSYLLLPLGFIQNEFFPKSDQDELYISLELPSGTKADITQIETLGILQQVKNIPELDFATAQIQASAGGSFFGGQSLSNEASITLVLQKSDNRKRTSIEIAQELRAEFASYQKGRINIIEESGGPPAGEDIEINLLGPDLDQLQLYADQVQMYLENLDGTTNVNRSVKLGVSKLVFVPDADKLQEHSLTEAQISIWLRTMASGWNLGSMNITEGSKEKEYDIKMKLADDNISPEDLNLLQIPADDSFVSLDQLGSLKLKSNPTLINRQDGQRNITITASALPGYRPPELYKQTENYLNTELNLDSAYSWKVGGVNEENQESQQSIINAMGISAILILVTMVAQLGSFRKAIIVMLVIPLSVSGVFIWFALTGTPLSFPALVGLLSLFGIVIANSLMIVDKVNQNQNAGLSMREAIIDASASRLEPIALTSASQVIGLIPITLADPLWRGMGGAIIAGLSFSGTIMLFFIPIVYYYFYPEEK